jgi:chemotaxis protein histidine kinase CheA
MSPEHSGSPIDALQAQLRQTLDTHLASLARQYEHAVDEARNAAVQDAEKTLATRLAAAEDEWTKRLETEVASARAEAERQLAAETTKVRAEAEQQAAESVARVREELEAALATERQRADSLVQGERQRAEQELEAARGETRQAAERLDQATRARTEAEQQARTHAEAHSAAKAELERHLEEQKQRQQKAPPAAAEISVIDGIRAIDGSRTLTEALEMVLRHTSSIAPRAAVFLINGARLRSWKTNGFPQFDAQPFESAITGSGLLAQAIQSGEPTFSGPSQPPPTFASLSGDLSALVVPVVLSGRAVALVYADNAGKSDTAPAWRDGVETLVRHASAHLALLTAMRTVQAIGASAPVGTGGAVRPESDTADQSARRYARLLVSEIKLYNEAAVRAGREQRDLLRRLRPEIDRARGLYEERISAGVGARGAYFQQELVQTLADGDPALLGNS